MIIVNDALETVVDECILQISKREFGHTKIVAFQSLQPNLLPDVSHIVYGEEVEIVTFPHFKDDIASFFVYLQYISTLVSTKLVVYKVFGYLDSHQQPLSLYIRVINSLNKLQQRAGVTVVVVDEVGKVPATVAGLLPGTLTGPWT